MSGRDETPRVVAIDGPSASGKSTTAREVAHRLGFVHLNSGRLYRAITWVALRDGWVAAPDFDHHLSYGDRQRISAYAVLPDGTRESIGSGYLNWSDAQAACRRWAAKRGAA